MSAHEKIILLEQLSAWRDSLREIGKRLVVTNGCFDLLHAGHVSYLEQAAALGDLLLVGCNGDESVRQLKGEGRPLNPEADRALVLSALESVGSVVVFPERRAEDFLRLAKPDVYVKGGDYTLEELDPEERAAVEAAGGVIRLLALVPGRSTSALVGKITND